MRVGNEELLSIGRFAQEAGEPIEIYEQHDPVPQTRIIWPVA